MIEIKRIVNSCVHFMNQPIVKEGAKTLAGSVTFAFGLVEIYDLYQIARGREISTEHHLGAPKWVQIAHKIILICAKVSLILSGGVSRPGVFIISSLVGSVFSTAQLDRVFGPNTIFAINPWHPRHVVSIFAVILALPSVAQSAYQGVNWVYKKVRQYQEEQTNRQKQEVKTWLTDTKIQLMALFNTITSRPTLHLGNQLGRLILLPH